jgi:hypothetical protein
MSHPNRNLKLESLWVKENAAHKKWNALSMISTKFVIQFYGNVTTFMVLSSCGIQTSQPFYPAFIYHQPTTSLLPIKGS